MKTICFYHKNCMDGKASAAVVHQEYPDAEFYPMQYGDKIPVPTAILSGAHVFIVDFSFSVEVMLMLKNTADIVTWIDHHKTSGPLLEELGWGLVDMKECGATLTWKHIHGTHDENEMPPILKYVRDRDLWKWELPNTRAVSAALAHRYSDDVFYNLLTEDPENKDLLSAGKKLLSMKKKQIEKNCARAYPVSFHGFKGRAVNSYEHVSETGEELLKRPDVEIAIMFWREADKWVHSLRSAGPEVDVSAIAKKYGGGGHAQAAGFTLPKLCLEVDE